MKNFSQWLTETIASTTEILDYGSKDFKTVTKIKGKTVVTQVRGVSPDHSFDEDTWQGKNSIHVEQRRKDILRWMKGITKDIRAIADEKEIPELPKWQHIIRKHHIRKHGNS